MGQRNDRRTRGFAAAAVLAAALTTLAGPASAQEHAETAEKETGREHVVRRGDTLWDLASLYLNNPFLWRLIFDANRGIVENPHWIYPAERLVIPGLLPDAAAALAADPTAIKAAEPQRTRFYRQPQAAPESAEIVAAEGRRDFLVPQVRSGDFYAAPWLSEPRHLDPVGEVVSVAGSRAEHRRISDTVHPRDRIYLRPLGSSAPAIGERLLLVEPGRKVDRWGSVIEPIAIATVAEFHEETMAVVVTEQFGMLEEGAYALPLERFPGMYEESVRPVDAGPQGTLIAFEDPQPLPSPRDRAFIDLGRADGLEVGDELAVYMPRRKAPRSDVMLPSERVARLRVLRVAERSATVQVVQLEQPALRPGLPVQLIAKRP